MGSTSLVTLVIEMEGESVFDHSKRTGVSPAEHVAPEEEEKEVGVEATSSITRPAKIVTVLGIPFDHNDNVVRYVLNSYGKVIAGRYLTYEEYPGLFNGTREYKMEIDTDIPSWLRFCGLDCFVSYDGQPRTCRKCGRAGHEAKGCRILRCRRCLEEGHLARRCTGDPVCSICRVSGHSRGSCRVSLGDALEISMSWV